MWSLLDRRYDSTVRVIHPPLRVHSSQPTDDAARPMCLTPVPTCKLHRCRLSSIHFLKFWLFLEIAVFVEPESTEHILVETFIQPVLAFQVYVDPWSLRSIAVSHDHVSGLILMTHKRIEVLSNTLTEHKHIQIHLLLQFLVCAR